jgi:putative molybdopterin biosynthesis protein
MYNALTLNSPFATPGDLPSIENARTRIISAFGSPGRTITLPISEGVGRILAEPLFSAYPIPGADVADVDGIALDSLETCGAVPGSPVVPEVQVRVDTGHPLPPGTDAVVPIEHCPIDGGRLAVSSPVRAGDGVRPEGSEMEGGTLLLSAGHRIRPVDVGPLMAAGVTNVLVRSARIGVIPTGGELVPPGTVPRAGENVASNPHAIRALLALQGAATVVHPIVPDDPVAVRRAITTLRAEVDLVVVCGGSGRGTRDVAFDVVRSFGDVIVDGVSARPGRAFLVVRSSEGTPIISLPGRPQPITLLTEYFIVTLLEAWGLRTPINRRVRVELGLAIVSAIGFAETVPLTVARVGEHLVGVRQPRGRRGALSQFRANARVLVPDGIEGYRDEVEVDLLDDSDGPERQILVVGAIDVLDAVERIDPEYRVALVPCSEAEALVLLRRAACHLAILQVPPDGDVPTWTYRNQDGICACLAVPPNFDRDPKVTSVLAALGLGP